MRLVLAIAVAGVLASPADAGAVDQDTPTDIWATLRFLIGSWEGTSHGQAGNGTVSREYRFVLRDRYIEMRGRTVYPPQENNPKGETHEEIAFISYDRTRKTFVLRQFHVEGFVNTYVAGPPSPNAIVFTSEAIENIPAGWRARETYRLTNGAEPVEVFELAAPGAEFTVYSETRLKKRQ